MVKYQNTHYTHSKKQTTTGEYWKTEWVGDYKRIVESQVNQTWTVLKSVSWFLFMDSGKSTECQNIDELQNCLKQWFLWHDVCVNYLIFSFIIHSVALCSSLLYKVQVLEQMDEEIMKLSP